LPFESGTDLRIRQLGRQRLLLERARELPIGPVGRMLYAGHDGEHHE
jgi:hypothetical protein